jgi:cold shock protein
MKTGTVKWFNPQKGHGFIRPDDGSPNILVHLSAVHSAGMGCLEVGQRVIFEIEQNERTGSIFATALTPLEFESSRRSAIPEKSSNRDHAAPRWPFHDNKSVRYHCRLDLVGIGNALTALRACSGRTGAERLVRAANRRVRIYI